MNIQIFGASKSFDTKKAQRWFKERRIPFQYNDLPSKGLSPREYQSVKQNWHRGAYRRKIESL